MLDRPIGELNRMSRQDSGRTESLEPGRLVSADVPEAGCSEGGIASSVAPVGEISSLSTGRDYFAVRKW